MEPYVRDFSDPAEGLLLQLEELEGFARTVPPLIEADRQQLWDKVMAEPGDPDEDPADAYGAASGRGTGGGFADFARTVYVASLVLGFEAFKDYLVLHLAAREGPDRWFGRRTVRNSLEEKLSTLPFPKLVGRYERVGVSPKEMEHWNRIEEIHLTRNALVHNHGRYTRRYFMGVATPRYPTNHDTFGIDVGRSISEEQRKEWLVDRENIPISYDYVAESLHTLAVFAQHINDV